MRGLSCVYSTASRPAAQAQKLKSVSMQDRVGQLENLVLSLKSSLNAKQNDSQDSQSTPPPDTSGYVESQPSSREEDILGGFGRIILNNDGTNYVESAHWTAILDEVSASQTQQCCTQKRPRKINSLKPLTDIRAERSFRK